MNYLFNHIDWLSIKMNLAAITLAWITGKEAALVLAALASLSTIAYNAWRFYKDIKNKS